MMGRGHTTAKPPCCSQHQRDTARIRIKAKSSCKSGAAYRRYRCHLQGYDNIAIGVDRRRGSRWYNARGIVLLDDHGPRLRAG